MLRQVQRLELVWKGTRMAELLEELLSVPGWLDPELLGAVLSVWASLEMTRMQSSEPV